VYRRNTAILIIFLTFRSSCSTGAPPPPWPIMVKCAMLELYSIPMVSALPCQFQLDRFIVLPLRVKTPEFNHITTLSTAAPLGAITTLSVWAQMQTFPYPTPSKSFLSSNDWRFVFTNFSVRKRDGQATKHGSFHTVRRRAKSKPATTLYTVIGEIRSIFAYL